MFTKFKQSFETWLRGLFADEVAKINRDLRCERAALRAQIGVFDSAFKSFTDAVKDLSEVKRNVELQEHVNALHAQITTISDLVKTLHPVT